MRGGGGSGNWQTLDCGLEPLRRDQNSFTYFKHAVLLVTFSYPLSKLNKYVSYLTKKAICFCRAFFQSSRNVSEWNSLNIPPERPESLNDRKSGTTGMPGSFLLKKKLIPTVGIMAVNMRNSMQKNSMAALLYTLLASLPARPFFCFVFTHVKV